MQPKFKRVPAEFPQPSVASINTSQAFTGLRLQENVEVAEALEYFVRGYISCTTIEGFDYVPASCAEQALKTFAHHVSWGRNGFPWDRLDRNWKIAAMGKIAQHVRDGHSLEERPVDVPSFPDLSLLFSVEDGRDRPSTEGDDEEPDVLEPDVLSEDDSGSSYNDDEDDEVDDAAPGPSIAAQALKGKAAASKFGRIALAASRPLDLPYELPFSTSPEPPSPLAALKRTRNNSSSAIASSSSPLSTLPSSMFKSLLPARTKNDRRQTRIVTRAASSRSGTPGSTISKAVARRQSIRLQQQKKKQKQATDTGEPLWPFDAILDSRVKGKDVEYRIKWTKGRPTWQTSLDLRDTPEEIDAFHKKYPEKAGPPGWFVRGLAKANMAAE